LSIVIQILIFVTLLFFIKKFSSSVTPYGLLIFYLLVLYDNTIITGSIINNNPIFFIQASLTLYLLIYALSRKSLFDKNLSKIIIESKAIIFFYFMIFIVEILRLFIQGLDVGGLQVVTTDLLTKILFILLFIFLLTRNQIFDSNNFFKIIIRPYFFISLSIITSSVVIIGLIVLGFVDLDRWTSIPEFVDPQIHYRRNEFLQDFGLSYHGGFSFPFNISLFWIYDFLGVFQGLFGIGGRAIGLSKEPHIACLFLSPSLFIVKYFIKYKIRKIVYLFYAIFFASALSMSNIIALLVTFIIYQYKSLIILKNIKKRTILFSFLSVFILLGFILTNYDIIDYVINRLNEISISGSSGQTVFLRFKKLFVPDSFWGTGLLVSSINNKFEFRDYGFFPMLVFLIHYISIFYLAIKLYFSRNNYKGIGLAIIYILVHGIKVYADLPINYFYLFLILSLIFISKDGNWKNKLIHNETI